MAKFHGDDFSLDTDDVTYISAINTPLIPGKRTKIGFRSAAGRDYSVESCMDFTAVQSLYKAALAEPVA